MVTFECDSNKMLAELNSLGKLVEKVRSGIDYKSKKLPLVSVCEKGNATNQLNYPRSVTVDNEAGNICMERYRDGKLLKPITYHYIQYLLLSYFVISILKEYIYVKYIP